MTWSLRLLVVEEATFDTTAVLREMQRGGYVLACTRVETAEDLEAALDAATWDVVIAGYQLPELSAQQVLLQLRERELRVPAIVLCDAVEPDAAISVMHLGAADYVVKGDLTGLVRAIDREAREAAARDACRHTEQVLLLQTRLLDAVNQAVIMSDLEGIIRYWNRFAETLYGWRAVEALGRSITIIMPDEPNGSPAAALPAQLRAGRSWSGECIVRRRDGSTFPALMSNSPVYDECGLLVGSIGVSQDITRWKQAEEELRRQALHDALTGLPNRTLLQDRLEQGLLVAQRTGTTLALLVLDLDRFKEVNDTLGHQHGDQLLQQVARRMQATLRETDTVARLGGDEFAIVLPGDDDQGAVICADKVAAALERPVLVAGQSVQVGMSIGIALFPEHGTEASVLLRRAEVAMYVAKRRTETIAMYESAHDAYTPARLALIADLRRAIEHGELTLHYQPKVWLAAGKVQGVEALVRWLHPQRGLLGPDQFIALAEETGLIGPLTRWVLQAAVRQCAVWHRTGLPLCVAVNLSMANLHDPQLPGMIATLLERHALPPSALRIEVTESMLMADLARTQDVLGQLAALGLGLSVDDYGTGYSSLAYLKRLPVDELKIDQSFVQHLAGDETNRAIVASTIGLGHSLGLQVVAEGVEDHASCVWLEELGCDVAQGYYLSRPLPVDQLEPWLETRRPYPHAPRTGHGAERPLSRPRPSAPSRAARPRRRGTGS